VRSVGLVGDVLARPGRGLDMWRGVNAGEPAGSVGDWLAGLGDGPMGLSP
jgi:hypothetical protein